MILRFKYFFSFVLLCNYMVAQNFDKSMVPEPIFDENKDLIRLYYEAWQSAYDHIKYQEGVVQSPYVDEAFWDHCIWIWDTEFMVLFCKYAPDVFPGIESLNNFYAPIHDGAKSTLRINHPDNPPFFAWVEYEYFQMTGDLDHVKRLMNETKYLQKHFEWFHNLKPGTKLDFVHDVIAVEWQDLGYKWGGIQSGMDNTPRGRNMRKQLLWIDAISQQTLSAFYIAKLCKISGNKADEQKFTEYYKNLKKIINTYYWDSQDGFYYDITADLHEFVKVVTPASYWAVLAEVPNKKQAYQMMLKSMDENKLGGVVPWVTVSRDDKQFNSKLGNYWQGSVWLPTAYMGIKSLEKYSFLQQASEQAETIVKHMSLTHDDFVPHTIWECYNPNTPKPAERVREGNYVRPDFCGWSALGPISLFIENVIGFYKVDASEKSVYWHLHHKTMHGIKDFKFGNIVTDIIYNDQKITVQSNREYNLYVNDRKFKIRKGLNQFKYFY